VAIGCKFFEVTEREYNILRDALLLYRQREKTTLAEQKQIDAMLIRFSEAEYVPCKQNLFKPKQYGKRKNVYIMASEFDISLAALMENRNSHLNDPDKHFFYPADKFWIRVAEEKWSNAKKSEDEKER